MAPPHGKRLERSASAVLAQADQGTVELSAHDERDSGEIQPDQQNNDSTDGTVQHRVVGKVIDIHGIDPADKQPGGQSCQRTGPDIPPGLAAVLRQSVEEEQCEISHQSRHWKP